VLVVLVLLRARRCGANVADVGRVIDDGVYEQRALRSRRQNTNIETSLDAVRNAVLANDDAIPLGDPDLRGDLRSLDLTERADQRVTRP
jgi:hypothetical protein